jgi:septum formation protein
MNIVLASVSPRRREALALMGLDFQCADSGIEETLGSGIEPHEAVMMLARRKAEAVSKLYPDAAVIGADTVVVHRGLILGKPNDGQEAFSMLKALENDRHDVYTGLCVRHERTHRSLCDFRHSVVRFLPMDDGAIRAYIATGEPMDKAGAYAIQGRAAAYIHGIVGSADNVIGLPMQLLRELLERIGAA